MFFAEHRLEIVASLGTVENPMCAAAKMAGEMWKTLGDAGQTPYKERASKAREDALLKTVEEGSGVDRPNFLEAPKAREEVLLNAAEAGFAGDRPDFSEAVGPVGLQE